MIIPKKIDLAASLLKLRISSLNAYEILIICDTDEEELEEIKESIANLISILGKGIDNKKAKNNAKKY